MEPCLPDIYVPSTEAQLEEAKCEPPIRPIVQMQELEAAAKQKEYFAKLKSSREPSKLTLNPLRQYPY